MLSQIRDKGGGIGCSYVSLILTDDEAGALFLFGGHGGGWRCRRWGWWLTVVRPGKVRVCGIREFLGGVGHVLYNRRGLGSLQIAALSLMV